MLISDTITDPKAKEKEARLAEIGRVIALPLGVEKLQAIAALWMNDPRFGAENRWQMLAAARQAKQTRETRRNKFGTSGDKNSAIRMQFSPPAGLLQAIEAFYVDSPWGGVEGRKNWKIFKDAFPQFKTADKY